MQVKGSIKGWNIDKGRVGRYEVKILRREVKKK